MGVARSSVSTPTHSPLVPQFDLGSLVEIRCAAAPMGAELAARFHARFPSCTVSQGYGMTEASPGITLPTPADDAAGRSGVGRLVPTYEARLVTASGADARPGEPGEMWVRGPNVMKGYHGNAEANAAAFAPGHWFRTGDVLRQDAHGAFHVVDRLKELIKYKGFQVPPAELESLLLGHPAVVDAGVVGVHDERQATELPRAYVVLAGSGGSGGGNSGGAAQTTTPDDIAHWVAARVAQYKRLRGGVVVTEQIPRGPTGKILRNALRDRAKKEWAADADARARL